MENEHDKTLINSKDIDDYGRRNNRRDSYKNRKFNGKLTMKDEYTDKRIHFSQTKKGMLKGTQISNTDHIIPRKKLIDRYGNRLPKEDLRRIGNSDYNLSMTNEALNKSKGDLTNSQYIIREWKHFIQGKEGASPPDAIVTYNMIKKEVQANIVIEVNVAGTDIVNSVTTGYETAAPMLNTGKEYVASSINAGMDVAIVTFTISTINNIVMFATGEKNLSEVGEDILRVTGSSFITGAVVDTMQNFVMDIASKNGSELLKGIAVNGLPITEIATAVMVGDSVIRYLSGDISSEQCITEIVMNGTGILAYSLGMSLGGPAGAVIASVICSQICKAITDYKNIDRLNKEKLMRVNSIASKALIEMEYQRNILRKIIEQKYPKWDEAFDSGFEMVFVSTFNNDVDGISSGLNKLLSVIDKTVVFSTKEEFDKFFFDENAVLTL